MKIKVVSITNLDKLIQKHYKEIMVKGIPFYRFTSFSTDISEIKCRKNISTTNIKLLEYHLA